MRWQNTYWEKIFEKIHIWKRMVIPNLQRILQTQQEENEQPD
jgi:hypothetical protein